MAINWAITIGINHYDNLIELSCAKRDAEAIRDFFRDELRFQQIYHFTEDSPPIETDYGPSIVSRPTYGTLMRFLRVRFEKPFLQVGDNLWFFFAGHGIRHEDRDYLMPIDVDPGNVTQTAIPTGYIVERLRRSGAGNILLFLDAFHASGSRQGMGIGTEVHQGVTTIYASRPNEQSWEIEALQNGSFTYSLLEGLQI